MLDRQFVWSSPRLRALARDFIAAADEVERYQRSKPPRPPDVEFFWKISAQRPEDRALPTQGIYVVTPGGKLLAFRQRDHDPDSIAKLLSEALDRWKVLGREERLGVEAPRPVGAASSRTESRPPEGALILELFVRDLPRKSGRVAPELAAMWNRDFAWFTGEEVRSMVPEGRTPGERHRVPDGLVRRLARLHLLDSVRGINDARPDEKERGYEARLLGRATVNVRQGRFTSFALVAIGPRWGGRGYAHSMRQGDLESQPMGFALRMLPPSERVEGAVPHHAANYFTR